MAETSLLLYAHVCKPQDCMEMLVYWSLVFAAATLTVQWSCVAAFMEVKLIRFLLVSIHKHNNLAMYNTAVLCLQQQQMKW